MPVNKRDVVRIVKAGATDEAQKNALLALAGDKPSLWDGLDEEDVLGVLKQGVTQLETAAGDDTLKNLLANSEQMLAIFPAIALASNPFQSASSLSNKENKQKARDFKTSLLLYYFNQRPPGPPPGLLVQQAQHVPVFTIQCMVSQLVLDSNIVEAARILPKASAKWGDCVLGITDVWDERNGLLWAEPFEKAYHAHEIAVIYQPSLKTFRFRVLIESLMVKRLADYAKSDSAKHNASLQQHTFGEYDDTNLLMPSGCTPFRRTLTAHAAYSVALQRHKLRSALNLTKDDFDIWSDYDEKGTTASWVALQANFVFST